MKDDRKIVLAALKASADKAPLPAEAIPPVPTIAPSVENMTDCFLAAAKKKRRHFHPHKPPHTNANGGGCTSA